MIQIESTSVDRRWSRVGELRQGAELQRVVVGDDALTQAIIKLRKALGDDARRPAYIETLAKRGYRLTAPVVAEPAEARPASLLRASAPATVVAPAAAAAPAAEVALALAAARATSDAAAGAAAADGPAGALPAAESPAARRAAHAPAPAAASPAARAPTRLKPWRLPALTAGLAAIAIAAGLAFGIHRNWPWPIGSAEAPRAITA
ncbi:MAG: winged helix-turn-helix domain-containing protein [Rubrivivax sp.]|nr:winged helix-turn-helix domain-containing protein [Rubrivivax sp.]